MQSPTHSQRRILPVLLASIAIDYIGFGIVVPLLPFYAKSFGASPTQIGVLLGIFFLMSIFAPPLWGSLSDRIGRRPALILNVIGTGLSYLWLGCANSLWMLYGSRILAGASGASIVIAQSYVSDITTLEKRPQALSYLNAASGLGFVLGPAIAAVLMGSDPQNPNFRLPGFAAAAAAAFTLCLAFFALPKIKTRLRSSLVVPNVSRFVTETIETFQRPVIGFIFCLSFAILFSIVGLQGIFALWCEAKWGWGPQQFGYLIVFFALVTAIMQVTLTGWLVRRWGEPNVVLLSLVSLVVGLILIPLSTTVPQFIGALLFVLLPNATSFTVLMTLLSQLAGAKQQGKTLGLAQSIFSLAGFVGMSWSGWVFDVIGIDWPYWTSALLILAILPITKLKITRSRMSDLARKRRQQKLAFLFDILDFDKSGTIEREDFYQATRHLAELRGWEPGTPEYELLESSWIGFGETLQNLADLDGDGKIDREEWLQYVDKRLDYDFSEALLAIVDANKDNEIALEELKQFYQTCGIDVADIEEAFESLDLDGDGHISREEFKTLFSQFLYSDDIQSPGNWMFGTALPRKL